MFVNDSLEIERKGGFVNSDVIAKESTKHASGRWDSALVLYNYKTQKIAPGARGMCGPIEILPKRFVNRFPESSQGFPEVIIPVL